MRVLYDYQIFEMQKYGGISRCFAELYKNLPERVDARISLHESDNVYVQNIEGVRPKGFKFEHFLCEGNFHGKRRLFKWLDSFRKLYSGAFVLPLWKRFLRYVKNRCRKFLWGNK